MEILCPASPPTLPARPINCGNLRVARPKIGQFWVEPKITGMRVTLHVPTGRMWTRHGPRLSNPKWFEHAAGAIKELLPNEEWLDCEGLYQAHNVGKGTIVILDDMVRDVVIEDRRELISDIPLMPITNDLKGNEVYRIPYYDWSEAKTLWDTLLELGADWVRRGFGSVPLFEGVVGKKKKSKYPFQTIDPKRESADWQKHRFA